MVNLAYVISRQLRKDGIDSELIMEKNPPKNSDPLLFDPDLNNEYPDWIHFYDKSKSSWKFELIKKLRDKKFDLIHAYVELPMFAYLSQRPYVANTQGSDFREMALSNSSRGILLRRAYRKAKAVLFFQPDHLPIFTKLKLKNGIFLPPLWDTSLFKHEDVSNNRYQDKFVIFHPANLEWRLKGNDILIKGYSQFVKQNPNSIMIIVDRGIDSQKSHDLVNKLKIENKVEFVKGPLTSSELLKYYNLSDVIADQFVLGALGSIGWEVFSCNKPLLAFVNEEQYQAVYGQSPPIANATNQETVFRQLENLQDNNFRKKIGKLGHDWLIKHHSPQIFSKKLTTLYELILNKEGIEQIRESLSKLNNNKVNDLNI